MLIWKKKSEMSLVMVRHIAFVFLIVSAGFGVETSILAAEEDAAAKKAQPSPHDASLAERIKGIKEDQENVATQKASQEKQARIARTVDELLWIRKKNEAYVKDWRENYDCLVGKRAAEVMAINIEYLQSRRRTVKQDCASVDPKVTPNLAALCKGESGSLEKDIAQYKEFQKAFESRCN